MKNCPFYGFYISLRAGFMIEQHGNQCALITDSYSPCEMETEGKEYGWGECQYNNEASMKKIDGIVVVVGG